MDSKPQYIIDRQKMILEENILIYAPKLYRALKQAIMIIEAEPEACGIYKAHLASFKDVISKIEER